MNALKKAGNSLLVVFAINKCEFIAFTSLTVENIQNDNNPTYLSFSGRTKFPIDGKSEAHGYYNPITLDGWIVAGPRI